MWPFEFPPLLALAFLVLAVTAGAVAWFLWRQKVRRRLERLVRAARRRGRPRYPVVLAHGLFGFDEVTIGNGRHAYFRGVSDHLEKQGYAVNVAKVPPRAGIVARAHELTSFIKAIDAPKVNIIAHSMGGLDARYAIAKLGLAKRVASLTTVGTPHHGTPLAEVGVLLTLGKAGQSLGLSIEALQDLTAAQLESFNAAIKDSPNVSYCSIVGTTKPSAKMNPLLLPTYLYLKTRVGKNDGVVPAASQKWGDVLYRIDADHWAQIGWSRHFDAADFYAKVLKELRGRGL